MNGMIVAAAKPMRGTAFVSHVTCACTSNPGHSLVMSLCPLR
jgi:hypothetical protein